MNTSKQSEEDETILTDENATKSTPPPTPPGNSAPTNLICSFCDKKLPLDKYKKCDCKTTIYCMNASCQKEHWKVHKTEHHRVYKTLNAVKNEGEEDDDSKSGSKTKTSSPTIQRKPIQKEQDECPICLDNIKPGDSNFTRFICCGKGLHDHCSEQLCQVKSDNIRNYCPLCRTKHPTTQEEAITQFQKWVKKKKAWAQCSLGSRYLHGSGSIKRDVKRAFVLYTLAAEQGEADAQSSLGIMYRDGIGTKPDVKRALELFTLSAEQGLAKAQYNLGCMYLRGTDGVKKDVKRAFVLYTLAAKQRNANAQYVLGNMYADGDGTKIDVKHAVKLYRLSAEQGLDKAEFNLGYMYATGRGVEQSFTTAREWIQKAAAQGFEQAIAALPEIDENIRRTTTTSHVDKKETLSTSNLTAGDRCLVHLLESEAGQLLNGQHVNLVDGIIRKGRYRCRFEDGTIRNVKLNNLKKIQVTTGDDDKKETSSTTTPQEEEEDDCPICLETLPKNPDKFTRMACCGKGMHVACGKKQLKSRSMSYEQRNTCCLCRTPLNYEGSKEDIEQLRFWVERGKGWSMASLGDNYKQGLGVPQDPKRAFELYRMAVEVGEFGALYSLGVMYYNGEGTERDDPKAKELFMRAATLGHVGAILALKQNDKYERKTTPSFTVTRTSCSFCGVAHAPPEVKLNPCSGCHSVYYCSKEHQRTDWKIPGLHGHKEMCKKLQNASK